MRLDPAGRNADCHAAKFSLFGFHSKYTGTPSRTMISPGPGRRRPIDEQHRQNHDRADDVEGRHQRDSRRCDTGGRHPGACCRRRNTPAMVRM